MRGTKDPVAEDGDTLEVRGMLPREIFKNLVWNEARERNIKVILSKEGRLTEESIPMLFFICPWIDGASQFVTHALSC